MRIFFQKGWIQWWKARSFPPLENVQLQCRMINLDPWGHLEVVTKCVVPVTYITLTDIMVRAHITRPNPTYMSFNFDFLNSRMWFLPVLHET
jgi:hypothetical protein